MSAHTTVIIDLGTIPGSPKVTAHPNALFPGQQFVKVTDHTTEVSFHGTHREINEMLFRLILENDRQAGWKTEHRDRLIAEARCESGPVFPDLDSDVGGPCVVDLGKVD